MLADFGGALSSGFTILSVTVSGFGGTAARISFIAVSSRIKSGTASSAPSAILVIE
jgi:hypothetical protein